MRMDEAGTEGIRVDDIACGILHVDGIDVFHAGSPDHDCDFLACGMDGDRLRFAVSLKSAPEEGLAEYVRRRFSGSDDAFSQADRDRAFSCVSALGLLGPRISLTDRMTGVTDLAVTIAQSKCRSRGDAGNQHVPAVARHVQDHLDRKLLGDLHSRIGEARMAFAGGMHAHSESGWIVSLLTPKPIAEAARAASLRWPLLAPMIFRIVTMARKDKGVYDTADPYAIACDTLELMRNAIGVDHPSLPALLARLEFPTESGLQPVDGATLLSLPLDWIPGTGESEEWDALLHLTRSIRTASKLTGTGVRQLCASSGGRWRDFARRLGDAAGVSLTSKNRLDALLDNCQASDYAPLFEAVSDIDDMAREFASHVVLPLAARAGSAVAGGDGPPPGAPALFAGRGLPRILEVSRKWHVRGNEDGQGLTGAGRAPFAWEAVLPDWIHAETGLRFVTLTDRASLVMEGSRADGGLHHCVGSYWQRCRNGENRIVSVRRDNPDGSFRRVSTIEIGFSRDGVPKLSQHRGIRNRPPEADAVAAGEGYLAGLADGSIPVDVAALMIARSRAGALTVEDGCGYDWRDDAAIEAAIAAWRPYLGRNWMSLDLDEFTRALGIPLPERAPSP